MIIETFLGVAALGLITQASQAQTLTIPAGIPVLTADAEYIMTAIPSNKHGAR